MSKSKLYKRTFSLLLCLLCALPLLSAQASAAAAIDPERSSALTIEYTDDGSAVQGIHFDVYYFAGVSAGGEYALTGDFVNYPVKINGLSGDEWRALAETLAAYVDRDGLRPFDSGETNEFGNLYFPNKSGEMKPGLYLVLGRTQTVNGLIYTTEPFVAAIPGLDAATGDWSYALIAQPKHSSEEPPDSALDKPVSRRVIKVWSGDVAEFRPEEIVVQLLRDGKVYDTVRLTAANNWRYSWPELPKYNDDGSLIVWRLAEETVDNYIVSITQEGVVFVVTNTYEPEGPSGGTVSRRVQKRWSDTGYEDKRPDSVTVLLLRDGEVYDTQLLSAATGWQYTWTSLPRVDANGHEISWTLREEPVSGYTPSTAQNGNIIVLTNSYDKPRLPQTGQLWWPVPLLAALGLAFIIVGVSTRRKENG